MPLDTVMDSYAGKMSRRTRNIAFKMWNPLICGSSSAEQFEHSQTRPWRRRCRLTFPGSDCFWWGPWV